MKNPTTTTRRPLPGVLASAIATIRWPLDAAHHPPLHLRALHDLPTEGRSGCRLDSTHPLAASQLPSTLDEIFNNNQCDNDDDQQAFGTIATALVLLGHGHADEAHSLVTPYSWPDDVHFNHGRVRYHETSAVARLYAAYTHSLVHRYEAFHTGEFGMPGWQNANYWSNVASSSQGAVLDELPHGDFFRCVGRVVEDFKDTCAKAEAWAVDHQIRTDSTYYFESRAVHELCADAMRQSEEDSGFRSFAELVAETELRVLLAHSLERAGFAHDHCRVDAVLANRT